MIADPTSGPTPALELTCLAIVTAYVVVRGRADPRPRDFVLRLGALMVASWIAEDTCIRAYGFYGYHPGWSLFVDQVPILIVAIWPMVIHTAWDLARHLTRERGNTALVGAAIVLADASLIEPIAVSAGLWTWTEPGLFAVPPIGILGWSLFAFVAISIFERIRAEGAGLGTRHLAWLPVPAIGVHLALLVAWWAALRWLNHTVPAMPVVVLAWITSVALARRIHARGLGYHVPRLELALRIPAALFFFVLLALYAADHGALVAYALAFAPPYLVLTAQAFRAGGDVKEA